MRYGSLFTGIGGFDLGFDRAGMSCAWQVEIDRYATTVLEKHWPSVTRYEDVREVGKHNLQPVSLIAGGFPCQDISTAGSRKGLAGTRSGLWFEFYRILTEVKPAWAVIENVPGLLSSNSGKDFGLILYQLGEIGYHVAWRVLDSQYFGVPQRRRRIFIVGHIRDGRAAEVLFEFEGMPGDFEQGEAQRESATARTGKELAGYRLQAFGQYAGDEIASSLKERDHKGATDLVIAMDSRNLRSTGDVTIPLQAKSSGGQSLNFMPTIVRLDQTSSNGWGILEDGTTHAIGSTQDAVTAFDYKIQGSPRTQIHKNGDYAQLQATRPDAIASSTIGVRRLTPVECLRLQGFPDDWQDIEGLSDTQKYKQAGNAVTRNVAEWLGRRIVGTGE